MTRHTLKKVICLSILGCLLFHDYLGQDKASAHEVKFSSIVKPFLKEHCESCHGAEKDKGDLTLHTLTAKKPDENELKKLQGIYEQLALSIMPPEKKPQPSENSKKEVLKWISDQMASVGQRPFLEFKMKTPEYGNYINHEKLFSGEIKEAPYTPSRIWRSSPEAFDNFANRWGSVGGVQKGLVKQPYIIPEKIGFKDFSSLYYADEGTFSIIMTNIQAVIENLISRAETHKILQLDPNYLIRQEKEKLQKRKEDLHQKIKDLISKHEKEAVERLRNKKPHPTTEDIEKAKEVGKSKAHKHPYMKKYLHYLDDNKAAIEGKKKLRIRFTPPPNVISKIYMNDATIPLEDIQALIDYQYDAILQRSPTKQEQLKLVSFFKECQSGSDNVGALKNLLKAIALNPESIYRMEIGIGPHDEHGRQFLNSANLAYAISLALSDQKIDTKLLEAASTGKLKNKEDVKREVTRLLNDENYDKPRLLRFFREYFGYHRTGKVFKDSSRYPGKLGRNDLQTALRAIVLEADTLVLSILKEDKEVLKNLLTTDKYFVMHKGENKDTKGLQHNLMMIYRHIKPVCDKWSPILKKIKNTKGRQGLNENRKKMTADLEAVEKELFSKESSHKWSGNYGRTDFQRKFVQKAWALYYYYKECEELKITPNPYYGVNFNRKSAHLVLYNLDPDTWSYPLEQPFVLDKKNRIGILSHPAWLLSFSHNFETDPINRGKWIQKFLLGGTVPDVPIDVDAQLPHAPKNTLRERFGVTEKEECWKCHEKMNPLGYPLEAFDDFGVFRTHEKLEQLPKINTDENGEGGTFPTKAVNVTGALEGTGNPKLDGPVKNHVDMIRRLAESEKVRQVFVRHAFRYFMGRNEMLSDSKTLIEADQAYVKSGGSFKALVLSLLTSDSFLYRKDASYSPNDK